jgi:hypothetical protein
MAATDRQGPIIRERERALMGRVAMGWVRLAGLIR